MSSCAASCCTCCPKASSVFATLASSPTAGAPLCCHFAFNYSAQSSHRRPNQNPPLSPASALSQMWRTHGGYRETYRGPAPTPFSIFSCRSRRMKQQFQAPSLGEPHRRPALCALPVRKQPLPFHPRRKISVLPQPNHHPTNHAFASL